MSQPPSGASDRSASLATSVTSLLSTLKQTQTYDYLRASANADLTKYLYTCSRKDATPSLTPPPTETIQFADDVLKINRKQKRQERVLVITDKALYNFAPGSFKTAKRRILIRDLRGLILSRCSDELVFQVCDSYDYRYEIKRRSEVLEMLSRAYEKVTAEEACTQEGAQLMVSFSEEKELKDMVITKDVLKSLQQVSAANALRNTHVNGLQPVQVDIVDHPPSSNDGGKSDSTAHSTSSGGNNTSTQQSHATTAPSPTHHQQMNTSASPSHATQPATPSSQNTNPSSSTSATPNVPPTPPAKFKGSVRQSLITHGQAALLAPHLLAKIAAAASGNFPSLAKQSLAIAHHGQSGQFPQSSTTPTHGPRGLLSGAHPQAISATGTTPGAGGYHAQKHSSIMISGGGALLSGSFSPAGTMNRPNRSASKTLVGPLGSTPSSQNNGSSRDLTGTSLPTSQQQEDGGSNTLNEHDGSDSSLHAFRDPNSRLEGWLTKQKGSSKKWDRKYFILTHRSLQYYAPRIKGNVKLKPEITVNRFNSDISLGGGKKPSSSSSSSNPLSSDTPLIMLRIESSSSGVKGKNALILAFACEEDASQWTEGFLSRNITVPPQEYESYPHLEGWLLRKEKDHWSRRYVVLTQDRVWFFEMVLKGSVEFTKGVSAHSSNQIQPTEEPLANNFAGRYALTRFAYRWNVSDAVRIFHLAADSEEDMLMWISAIDHVNREHGKGGGGSGALTSPTIMEESSSLTDPAASSGIQIPSEFREAVEQPAPEGLVAFVFTDVQNSTSLWEKVPDAMDLALEQHDRILRELLKRYQGYEVKTEGDAFMCTFFTALDAVLWCLHVQVALLEAEWSDEFLSMQSARKEYVTTEDGKQVCTFNGIRIRMGIHVGCPNARRNPVTGRMDYFGPVVNRSARVSDTGHGGQVVCTSEVVEQISTPQAMNDARLTSELKPSITDMGSHSLKGINEPVKIFQLMPAALSLRTLPPIRTVTNEKLEEARKKAAAASATAGQSTGSAASSPTAAPTPSPTSSTTTQPSTSPESTTVASPIVPPPPSVAELEEEENV